MAAWLAAVVGGQAGSWPLADLGTARAASPTNGAPAPSMRGLERYIGRRMIDPESGHAVELRREGALVVIEQFDAEGQSEGQYLLGASDAAQELQMLRSAYGHAYQRRALWVTDDHLRLGSQEGLASGNHHSVSLRASETGLRVTRYFHRQKLLGIGIAHEWRADGIYVDAVEGQANTTLSGQATPMASPAAALEASAQPHDTSAAAALPPAASVPHMRDLERFIGKRMVHSGSQAVVELRRENSQIILEVWDAHARPAGRYVLAAPPGKPASLEMVTAPAGHIRVARLAKWVDDRRLDLASESGIVSGQRVALSLIAEGDALRVLRKAQDYSFATRHLVGNDNWLMREAPAQPRLEGSALAEQNALNRAFFRSLVNQAHAGQVPGRWYASSHGTVLSVSESADGFHVRQWHVAYNGDVYVVAHHVVFDDTRGTWTLMAQGKPERSEYVSARDGRTWDVEALPEHGLTPNQAVHWSTRWVIGENTLEWHTLALTANPTQHYQWMDDTSVAVSQSLIARQKGEAEAARRQIANIMASTPDDSGYDDDEPVPSGPSAAWLALERGVAEAQARADQSRADLYNTIDSVNRQAQWQREQQARAEQEAARARQAAHARGVREREEAQRQALAQQRAAAAVEAERVRQLQAQAEAERAARRAAIGHPPAAGMGVTPASSPGSGPAPTSAPTCRYETRTFQQRSNALANRADAEAQARYGHCPSRGTRSFGPVSCNERREDVWGKDARGVPVVSGQRTLYVCEATMTCTNVEVCESGPQRASAQ
jgi:hypothetical protein